MSTLFIEDVASYMRCSHSTVRRRIAEARAGNSTFPLPIHGEHKRGLWRKEDIENWSEAQSSNIPKIDGPSICNQKQDIEFIRKQLRELGINIKGTK